MTQNVGTCAYMPTNSATRKAQERARKRSEGLRPFEVWAHPSDWLLIRKLVERLTKRRSKK